MKFLAEYQSVVGDLRWGPTSVLIYRLKQLEDENAKLKRLLADAMLDNAALKEGEGIRTLGPNLGNVRRRLTPQHLYLSQNHLRHYWIRSFLAGRDPKPILLLPSDFRSGASPLLPRPSPANPGKQI
jgi:hypothetical protein